MAFAPIHNHSEYSALDGLATCREIAARCQAIGCTCCGLTDHGTVTGHLEFAKVLTEHDIKPVFGCELYHGVKTTFKGQERDQAHFIAGALNDAGLRNLWRLVDAASTNFRFVGRVNWEILKQHAEGLFATSACIQGLVAQGVLQSDPYDPLNRYLEIFQDNFFIEIHTYPGLEHEKLNQELVRVARERGIPLIYATDAHFASPGQYDVHDAYVCMQTGQKNGETIFTPPEDRSMWHPKSLYIQSEDEIRASLNYLPESAVDEALQNSADLAERCNASLPEIKRHLPAFVPRDCPWLEGEDKEKSAAQVLVERVEQGLLNRYGEKSGSEVWERASTELEVFLDAGLEHYFLQAWDFCEFCDQHGIKRGPGRGSAAGAIVAYALGITDVDPLKYDLIFERFYNPGRAKGFPDIDNDFPVSSRKKVREYLMGRWGRDKVRTIGTVTRLKPKAALDKTYKVCGVTYDEKEALKKFVDEVPDIDILGADSIGWSERADPGKTIYVMHPTKESEHTVGDKIEAWVDGLAEERAEYVRIWLEVVEMVCSRVSGYGVHPSGVVVSDVSLADELPCMWNAKQEVQVTCFPMSDVDARLFVKQDLLGLRNLDTLQDWEDQVADKVGNIDWSRLDNDDIPEDGWKLLDHGLSLGIFQIEDGYGRHLCKEFKPRSIEDLSVIVALNRPGPIRSGAVERFIKRRAGLEEVVYDHPILEDLLVPTYGEFLYQEQVIRFFERIGYSLSDADAVRKILGKKKPEEMRDLRFGQGDWQDNGYMAAAIRAGIPEDVAERIMDKIGDFAKYSFNKSHSVAYAVIAFRTLFAKYWGPAEFIMACIRTNPDDAGAYVGEGRRMGISVLSPDILRSQPEISVQGSDILFGLSNIKGIGVGTARYICELRERYDTTSPELLDAALELETALWENARDAAKDAERTFKKRSPRQVCPANRIPPLIRVGAFDAYGEAEVALAERQQAEKELLGVIVTDNCEEIFKQHWEDLEECDSYLDLEENGRRTRVPGAIATLVPKRTKKDNKAMGLVTIEYQGDQAEFVVFPREWANYRFLWKERTPAIFALCRTDRGLRFDSALKLT